jgi:hypothetical protein
LAVGGFGGREDVISGRLGNEFSSKFENFKFMKDEDGAVTHLIYQAVEGDYKASASSSGLASS